MKKFFIIIFLIFFININAKAAEFDYVNTYLSLPVPTFNYIHGIDPGQYYDYKTSAYAPYPNFRLASSIYFKTITIMPGYYLLTPTNYKGNDYILFKQNGVVKHIIPVYKKGIVPEGFYEAHIPQPKLTFMQRAYKNTVNFVGKHFKRSQKKPTPASFLEVEELDNKFVSIVIYYGDFRYYTIFRTIKM